MTAPDFRPYERRLASSLSLPRAGFLSNEEDEEEEDIPGETGPYEALEKESPYISSTSVQDSDPIYIDEVFDRAQK